MAYNLLLVSEGHWQVRCTSSEPILPNIRRQPDGSFMIDEDPEHEVFQNGEFHLAVTRAREIGKDPDLFRPL